MDHGRILALDTPEGLKRSVGVDTIVTVKASGDQAALAASLEAALDGVTRTRVTEHGVELHVKGGERLLARCVAVAEEGGYEVEDLSLAEPTLETVFINLTGKELRD
jgi:ABC-2 type transport system ATP-binding protein